jgi:hypothetical protein
MPKFNTNDKRGNRTVTTPVTTANPTRTMVNHQGGTGYVRTAESELFLLALAHLGEKTFYENAKARDARFESLVAQVAAANPEWMKGFLPWLRKTIGMRYASIVATGVTVKTWLDTKTPGGRQLIADVLTRGDEPGEFLAFWQSRYMTAKKRGADGLVTGGQHFPKPVMRGVADGIRKLGTERNLLKWDTESHGWRFADILAMVHPSPKVWWQDKVFGAAINRRYGRPVADDPGLRMMRLNRELRATTDVLSLVSRTDFADALRDAGFTWEDALSLWGGKVQKNLLWEAMIPSMGLLALIRNLRNFDEAGVSERAAMTVTDKLKNADDIAGARLFPFQVFAAYKEAPSLRWAYPLEQALNLSLSNVPALPGRTLIMVDTSGSMGSTMTALGKMTYWETAALFGIAVASRAESAQVFSYSNERKEFPLTKGESVLKGLDRFRAGYFFGGGTQTFEATNGAYNGHDRIIILTDEQPGTWARGYYGRVQQGFQVPKTVPIYTWNLAGYKLGHNLAGEDNRHTFGGLSDQAFRMIPLLEAGISQKWPWLE